MRTLGMTVLAIGLTLGGCTARELAWMVPRASVGFALRTHEGQVASAGFVTLTAPLERAGGRGRALRSSGGERLRLLGAPSPCRLAEACRWEGRARAGTLADLRDDASLIEGAP